MSTLQNARPEGEPPSNTRLSMKLVVIAAVMFAFGFAMIPIYKAICEVTGVGLVTPRDKGAEAFARNTQVDTARTVVVEFDSNSHGGWTFKPKQRSVEVHPGELVTVEYELVNTHDRVTAGQAIPSYAPKESAGFFRKLECFCFQQQTFGPNEIRRFPVVFVVDPALPRNVGTITLSYTFFEVAGRSAGAPQESGAPKGSRGG